MSEFIQGPVAVLVTALIVSIVTAWLTVRLSMKQFYSQRWWERKAEAYSRIVEHLSYLDYFFDQLLRQGVGGFDWYDPMKEGDKQWLLKAYREGREAIAKAVGAGAYIVSDDTASTLRSLLRQLITVDLRRNRFADIKSCRDSVTAALLSVKNNAKSELKGNSGISGFTQ